MNRYRGVDHHRNDHRTPCYSNKFLNDKGPSLSYYNGYNLPFQTFAEDVCYIAHLLIFRYCEDFLNFVVDHLYGEARDVVGNRGFRDHFGLLDLLNQHFNNSKPRYSHNNGVSRYDNGSEHSRCSNMDFEYKDNRLEYYQTHDPSLPDYDGYNMPFGYFAEEIRHIFEARIFRYYEEFIDFIYDHLYGEAKHVMTNYLDDHLPSCYDHRELLDLLRHYFDNCEPHTPLEYCKPVTFDRACLELTQGNYESSKVLPITEIEESELEKRCRKISENNLRTTKDLLTMQLLSFTKNNASERVAQIHAIEETFEITQPLSVESVEEVLIRPSYKENFESLEEAKYGSVTIRMDQTYTNAENSHSEPMETNICESIYSSDGSAQETDLSVENKITDQNSKETFIKLIKLKRLLVELVFQGEIDQSQSDKYEVELGQLVNFLSERDIDEALEQTVNRSDPEYSSEIDDHSEGDSELAPSISNNERHIRTCLADARETDPDVDEEWAADFNLLYSEVELNALNNDVILGKEESHRVMEHPRTSEEDYNLFLWNKEGIGATHTSYTTAEDPYKSEGHGNQGNDNLPDTNSHRKVSQESDLSNLNDFDDRMMKLKATFSGLGQKGQSKTKGQEDFIQQSDGSGMPIVPRKRLYKGWCKSVGYDWLREDFKPAGQQFQESAPALMDVSYNDFGTDMYDGWMDVGETKQYTDKKRNPYHNVLLSIRNSKANVIGQGYNVFKVLGFINAGNSYKRNNNELSSKTTEDESNQLTIETDAERHTSYDGDDENSCHDEDQEYHSIDKNEDDRDYGTYYDDENRWDDIGRLFNCLKETESSTKGMESSRVNIIAVEDKIELRKLRIIKQQLLPIVPEGKTHTLPLQVAEMESGVCPANRLTIEALSKNVRFFGDNKYGPQLMDLTEINSNLTSYVYENYLNSEDDRNLPKLSYRQDVYSDVKETSSSIISTVDIWFKQKSCFNPFNTFFKRVINRSIVKLHRRMRIISDFQNKFIADNDPVFADENNLCFTSNIEYSYIAIIATIIARNFKKRHKIRQKSPSWPFKVSTFSYAIFNRVAKNRVRKVRRLKRVLPIEV